MVKRLLKTGVFTVIVGAALYAGVRLEPKTVRNIWIDISRPVAIKLPFDIVEISENAERGLWIGPSIGRGWIGEAEGEALYKFVVPSDGKYYWWAYCMWHDECTNAIYAQINDMQKVIVGNDSVFNEWHWVRGFGVDLEKGMHRLVLSNHSDNIAVLKLCLTNSPTAYPGENAPVMIDLFFDGFDGCDDGNFSMWKQHSGSWQVEHPENQKDPAKKNLIGRSYDEALITLQIEQCEEYSLNVSVKSFATIDSKSAVGICFGMEDAMHYYQLRVSGLTNDRQATMQLIKKNGHKTDILESFNVPWAPEVWHEVELDIYADNVLIRVNGSVGKRIAFQSTEKSGIGLQLHGQIEACFDNVHVRSRRK